MVVGVGGCGGGGWGDLEVILQKRRVIRVVVIQMTLLIPASHCVRCVIMVCVSVIYGLADMVCVCVKSTSAWSLLCAVPDL